MGQTTQKVTKMKKLSAVEYLHVFNNKMSWCYYKQKIKHFNVWVKIITEFQNVDIGFCNTFFFAHIQDFFFFLSCNHPREPEPRLIYLWCVQVSIITVYLFIHFICRALGLDFRSQ